MKFVNLQGAEALTYPITIYVTRASLEAIRQVEAKGGKVTTVYYNKLGMEYLINPQKFGTTRRVPRLALPLRRYLIGMCSLHFIVNGQSITRIL